MAEGEIQKAATFLGEQGSFALSFAVGAVVIALYSRKRIAEFTRPPKGEEYDFTKMLTMGDIVGHSIFYKSYVFYTVFLEFLYFFICTSKPLVLLIVSDPSGATFEGSAWPLGAALLVVGLLPSVPAIAEIEMMLRGLAQRVASIPGEFYDRVTRLSRSEIEQLVSFAPDYKPEIRSFRRVHTLLISVGFADDDAKLMARSCVAARLFSQWTIDGGRIWSSEEFDKYKDIISVLRPKTELLNSEIETLTTATLRLPLTTSILSKFGITDASAEITPELVEKIIIEADSQIKAMPENPATEPEVKAAQTFEATVKRWKTLAMECDVSAKRLSALFAILARNDRETAMQIRRGRAAVVAIGGRKPDPVLTALVQMMDESTSAYPWSNAGMVAVIVGFVGCLVPLCLYLYAVDYGFHAAQLSTDWVHAFASTDATSTIQDALYTSLTLAFMFSMASMVALFLRSLKIEEGTWVPFSRFRRIPVSNYVAIIWWSSLAAFMPLVISYIGYYYKAGRVADLAVLQPSALVETLIYRYILGFSAVTFGIAVCILADIVDAKTELKHVGSVSLRVALAVIFIEFLCLIVNPLYSLESRPFWHNMVAVACYAVVALITFQISYTANKEVFPNPTLPQPDPT
ncbi:hypothetical protein ELI00_37110 [Rhizobium ruizarguesonis]|uniref:hypothetical protein n=1 Tax=Rhizobium ruizarguesonis TaxID=2081791 RepID=UPI001031FD14|nr:hypothetical protein [Rhizobium ruizarguesonis]TAX63567.1 hypothetical protein ELI00_37110 [Rhizobium ruizarguesonis]